MKRLVLAALVFGVSTAGAGEMETYYEKSGFEETPRYAETIDYCKKLASSSRWIHYTTFGTTPQGRAMPLLVVNKQKSFKSSRIKRKGRVVLLVQAGIHSGEIDGKDAGFMLLRDIAVTEEYLELLDHVIILFVPIFNVDGHERFGPYNRINQNGPKEMGWRTTAQNLNLNRDFLKADAPEMRAWLELYNAWNPDFFIDCHVTDGADYQYTMTYYMDVYGNMEPGLTEWTRKYISELHKLMRDAGQEIFPYVGLKEWPNPAAGMKSWAASPRFSTGYTALRNRPGLLLETHMLKDYKSRVTATYEMLKQTLVVLNRERRSLEAAIKQADATTASPEFRRKPFALRFDIDDTTVDIEFKGIEFDIVESDLTGGPWIQFNGKPTTMTIPHYNKQKPVEVVQLPEAYIIPPEWHDVITLIELHGIKVRRLEKQQSVDVASYRFRNVKWRGTPFEGRHTATFDTDPIEETRIYPVGSAVVDMNQSNSQLAAHILEPKGPDSFVLWGFFNTIFEQKEYAESYVMEKMARDMLKKDAKLRARFEKKKKEDPEFMKNPRGVLNWFYGHTPYWDKQKDVYPVGRVLDRGVVDGLQ